MGLYDRDYSGAGSAGMGGRGGPLGRQARLGGLDGLSANTWIIVINIIVFVLMEFSPFLKHWIGALGHFSTAKAFFYQKHFPDGSQQIFLNLEVWRFITFQFLHANLIHIAFNMLGLYMFGSMVEQQLGRKKYVAFYLLCGICGGLMYLALNLLGTAFHASIPGVLTQDPTTWLVGASAGVFGVIMACARIAPNTIVQLLFPPIPLKLRTVAYVYVGIAALNLLMGGNNAGGDAAHIGGAIAGFFFIKNSHLLADFFDVLDDSRPRKQKKPRREKPARSTPDDDRKLDAILEKIRVGGTESLTDAEKKWLQRETEQRRKGA
ncbi:MAG: rhomboid family intramembrane serine protease [Phycisphaerales bacterium]|jgi:membrane associated rhomboid family serine protease|nr:rhomboid family intramembrane serine protease [Phycisphaerales bacterium]